MKNAKADESYIQAAKYFRCEDCTRTQQLPKQTQKVSAPKPYEINHTVGIDINYLHDAQGETIQFLNMVDLGTDYQVEYAMRIGSGQPTSHECYTTFMDKWISQFRYPKVLRCDRGLHNRGVFYKNLNVAGVQVTNIGREAPYQIGKVERAGG